MAAVVLRGMDSGHARIMPAARGMMMPGPAAGDGHGGANPKSRSSRPMSRGTRSAHPDRGAGSPPRPRPRADLSVTLSKRWNSAAGDADHVDATQLLGNSNSQRERPPGGCGGRGRRRPDVAAATSSERNARPSTADPESRILESSRRSPPRRDSTGGSAGGRGGSHHRSIEDHPSTVFPPEVVFDEGCRILQSQTTNEPTVQPRQVVAAQ